MPSVDPVTLGSRHVAEASGQGTALAFVIVATLVLGALVVLPRMVARILGRRGPYARSS